MPSNPSITQKWRLFMWCALGLAIASVVVARFATGDLRGIALLVFFGAILLTGVGVSGYAWCEGRFIEGFPILVILRDILIGSSDFRVAENDHLSI